MTIEGPASYSFPNFDGPVGLAIQEGPLQSAKFSRMDPEVWLMAVISERYGVGLGPMVRLLVARQVLAPLRAWSVSP